jgi:hypothetical protein
MKYIDEWRTALLLGFFHDASLFFTLSRRRLEEVIAGVNMAVYEWHAHPHFRFLLISSPFCTASTNFLKMAVVSLLFTNLSLPQVAF